MSLVKINLITWERNPRMRKKNNEITFLVDNKITIDFDSTLHSDELAGESLTYRILKIIGVYPSSIKNMDYVRATVKCLRNDGNTGPKKN